MKLFKNKIQIEKVAELLSEFFNQTQEIEQVIYNNLHQINLMKAQLIKTWEKTLNAAIGAKQIFIDNKKQDLQNIKDNFKELSTILNGYKN